MIRNVARNVWQICSFPPNAINAYRVDDVLIDCGTRWDAKRYLRAVAGVDLKLVALTHVHPDHQGSAKAICEKFRCPLACHEADRAAMEGREPMGPPTGPIRFFSNLLAGPPHPVDRVLKEGDVIAGFRVIETPGHTMGHVIFFRETDSVAIAGDVATSMNPFTMRSGLHEPPKCFCVDASLNRQSIRKLAELNPETVLFGHGPPWRDAARLKKFADRLG
jgi:glyoxylase-like metal-dependent hydrolase (beta-lactamase superfamily II)